MLLMLGLVCLLVRVSAADAVDARVECVSLYESLRLTASERFFVRAGAADADDARVECASLSGIERVMLMMHGLG